MKLCVLGCYGGATSFHRPTGFLINDHILLDAGTVSEALLLGEQRRIEAALISHSHLDHCGGISFLVDNIFPDLREPLRIVASPETIEAIRSHMLNGTMWPDFAAITNRQRPTMRFEAVRPADRIEVFGLHVTPFAVKHTVPTLGFVICDSSGCIVYSGDTSDVGPVLREAQRAENLKLVMVEASWPDFMSKTAKQTGHLTPADLRPLAEHLGTRVPIRLFHMKPRFVDRIAEDAAALPGDVAFFVQGDSLVL